MNFVFFKVKMQDQRIRVSFIHWLLFATVEENYENSVCEQNSQLLVP